MTRVVYSPRFVEELAQVTSARIEKKIFDVLSIIEAVPTIGSRNIPSQLQIEFGPGVFKMVVDPFDIIYEYFEDEATVFVYTLIHQRMAR